MRHVHFAQLILFIPIIGLLIGCSKKKSEEETEPSQEAYQNITIQNGSGLKFNFYCNVSACGSENSNNYKNLIIYMHGGSLNANDYYNYAYSCIESLGKTNNTIVLAPRFQTSGDEGNYIWGQYGWKDAKQSNNGSPSISSFEVLDILLEQTILKNYNQVENIIFAGHSAGGQCTFRYALLSHISENIEQRINFLTMNPSSYTYIGPERWSESKQTFTIPNSSSCYDYDDWYYGLENLAENGYDSNITSSELQNSFPSKYVTYGLGTADNGSSDDNCGAEFMGNTRYDRGIKAYNYMKFKASNTNHEKIEVSGIGHDGEGMINSPEIKTYINSIFE